jgi:nickel-dependent lactate racemase
VAIKSAGYDGAKERHVNTIACEYSNHAIMTEEIKSCLHQLLMKVPNIQKLLIIPPDITRYYSMAGLIPNLLYHMLPDHVHTDILPATGTHTPMTGEEIARMFGDIPPSRFLPHNWRTDTVPLGKVPASFVNQVSSGLFETDISVELNNRLLTGDYDLILSIGQVVPHEVAGMANYSKNIFVGVGGRQMINKTHMLGAVCGAEKALGNDHAPVRQVFDYAQERFLRGLPLIYVFTVVSKTEENVSLNGLYIGDQRDAFEKAVALSQKLNIEYVERPAKKVVAYLESEEFRSTWVGNKAIYRTRMIVADGGELIVLAPGVHAFGENEEVDLAIRKFGYKGTNRILELYRQGAFENMLMVAAHLIHGSSDGHFQVTYATDPKLLPKEAVESVGFKHLDIREAMLRYDPSVLKKGWNTLPDGEELYYVDAPGLGLWKCRG